MSDEQEPEVEPEAEHEHNWRFDDPYHLICDCGERVAESL